MTTPAKRLTVANPDDLDGITLMRLRSENVKRVRLIDVTFGDGLTTVGGDNAAGKSSFLDSLKFALAGKAEIDAHPIHDGAQSATITADFGDGKQVKMRVIRKLKRVGESEFTTELEVEIPGHVTPSKLQDFLSKLAGGFSFDPMAFDELDDKSQFETLRKFVSGFDFTQNAKDRQAKFDKRTDVGRDQRREQAAADAIAASITPPTEPVDEAELTRMLREAGEHNASIETRRANRENALKEIERLRKVATDNLAATPAALDVIRGESAKRIIEWSEQIRELQRKCAAEEEALKTALAEKSREMEKITNEAAIEAQRLEAKLAAAGELPAPTNVAEIEFKLSAARETNRRYAEWKTLRDRKQEHAANADKYAAEYDQLTADITELDEAKSNAIRKAHLPIDGLGFGADFITLNGQPWKQASTAERINASTAIAMALNPKLKVILIRDGSNLGSRIKEQIAQMASSRGYRVLMELVDESGANSKVFIENGELGKPKVSTAAA